MAVQNIQGAAGTDDHGKSVPLYWARNHTSPDVGEDGARLAPGWMVPGGCAGPSPTAKAAAASAAALAPTGLPLLLALRQENTAAASAARPLPAPPWLAAGPWLRSSAAGDSGCGRSALALLLLWCRWWLPDFGRFGGLPSCAWVSVSSSPSSSSISCSSFSRPAAMPAIGGCRQRGWVRCCGVSGPPLLMCTNSCAAYLSAVRPGVCDRKLLPASRNAMLYFQ